MDKRDKMVPQIVDIDSLPLIHRLGIYMSKYESAVSSIAAKDAEIARLRAELADVTRERDASRLISEGLHTSNVDLRAALDKEREACDAWREQWNRCGYSATMSHDARVLDAIIAHDARRAAEAKEPR